MTMQAIGAAMSTTVGGVAADWLATRPPFCCWAELRVALAVWVATRPVTAEACDGPTHE